MLREFVKEKASLEIPLRFFFLKVSLQILPRVLMDFLQEFYPEILLKFQPGALEISLEML